MCGMSEPLDATAYVAAAEYTGELRDELGRDARPLVDGGRVIVAPGPARPAAWAHNVWQEPVRIEISSIGDGARALRELGRNWALAPSAHHRRAALIAEQLPHVSAKPLAFPSLPPRAPLGSWTLVEPGVIVASAACTSPFPNGEPRFVEDHSGPPSRAYLKLYEALTLAEKWPAAGERCVDLGASPGGWTWVLASLGAHVTSVDKADLAPHIAAMPNVVHLKESAFGLDPKSLAADWLVADIICYPARMLQLLERWLAVHPRASYVVTIKFKGEVDMAPLRALVDTHGGTLRHLFHGKHELTWTRLGEPE
jgi:23S rRNA (cytidine2498-2'-O)-methyltransferase